jgi:monoamine oxidase
MFACAMLMCAGAHGQAAFAMTITRRNLAQFAGALTLARAVSAAPVNDPDVVIVGAGIAGIAAAQVLISGGKRVQIVEGGPRIGGRCFTDTASFGVPFDRGAAWLKGGERNALAGFARLYDFEIGDRDARDLIFPSGARRPAAANTAYERAIVAVGDAIANAAEQDEDIPAGNAQPLLLDDDVRAWAPTASSTVGPLDMGVDLDALSAKDWFQRDEDEASRLIRQGFGTLVARLAFGLPITVNARARRVTQMKNEVIVETERGALRGRAVILTPSIGALTSSVIAFDPVPDAAMTAAWNGLQMGLLTKVAMHFAGDAPALGFPPDSMLIPQASDARGHVFHVRPFGAPLVVLHIGGSLAWEFAMQRDKATIDFARERLRALLGANADKGLRNAVVTDWGRNPLTRGAAAAALPGHWKARAALETPIGGRVFLAGEAQGGKAVQTVHGAYASGQRAARRVLRLLKV